MPADQPMIFAVRAMASNRRAQSAKRLPCRGGSSRSIEAAPRRQLTTSPKLLLSHPVVLTPSKGGRFHPFERRTTWSGLPIVAGVLVLSASTTMAQPNQTTWRPSPAARRPGRRCGRTRPRRPAMEMRPIGSSTSTVFKRLFEACSDAPDMEHAMVDATIARTGRKRGTQSQATARPSLRYHRRATADRQVGIRRPDRRQGLQQQCHHRRSRPVRRQGRDCPHPRRTAPLPSDADLYKWHQLIENFFAKLKEFKRIAMRADKTDQSFAATIYRRRDKLQMILNRP